MKSDATDISAQQPQPETPVAVGRETPQADDLEVRDHVYDFEIDLDSDSTHATVVRWVGRDRRVLELGPATGYMSKVFAERGCSVVGVEIDPAMARLAERFCERVIVGDLDTLDLEEHLGSERFDVIVAADVLEHLKDPLTALRRLRPFLVAESGYFVVSLPNIAHGSVRLALLQGKFSYQDVGLLDRTHLRFFTRESIERLFDEADLGIGELKRQELNIDASEVDFDRDAVSPQLADAIGSDPDARTYQFLLKAFPISQPGMRNLQERMRVQALAQDAARREVEDIRRELDATRQQVDELHAQLNGERGERELLDAQMASIAAREGELRAALVDAHDQVLRRDEELARVVASLERVQPLEAEHNALLAANQELKRAQSEAQEIIATKTDESRRMRVRLERILGSPPARLWYRIGGLPVVRRVVAQRTAEYLAAVDRDRGG